MLKIGVFSPSYNEKNIIEWIDYHIKCGFDKIIVYDDQSDIPIKELLDNNTEIDKSKVFILENFIGKYLLGTYKDGTKAPCSNLRSDYFFNKLKMYINDLDYLLSIDIDEYIYLGNFNNIHDLVKYYEPFDILYFYWRNFNSNIKMNETNRLIDIFTESDEIRFCGKSMAKIKSIKSQTSPHTFDPINKNIIFYPNDNYNFIQKDVYNIYHNNLKHSGISQDKLIEFNKKKNNGNNPYIAHYYNQDIKTWLIRRWIERPILIKNTKIMNTYHFCKAYGYSKFFYKSLINNTYFGLQKDKIDYYVDYIYNNNNKDNNDILNKHDNNIIAQETINDISKIWWNYYNNQKIEQNLDILNFYITKK